MNDLGYIRNPNAWHTVPCPIIRRTTGRTECAYLAGPEPIIYHGNIYDPKDTDRAEVFPSHEAILAAGWKVD